MHPRQIIPAHRQRAAAEVEAKPVAPAKPRNGNGKRKKALVDQWKDAAP